MTALSGILTGSSVWLNLLGALFLLYLAIRTARSAAAVRPDSKVQGKGKYWGAYGTTFLLTLANPMTIVSFAGIIAGFRLGTEATAPAQFVLGVFAGSTAWWFMLCLAVGATMKVLTAKALTAINYGAAVVLAGYGLFNLVQAVSNWS
ncbi:LysE family transporter [Cohnella sp.]|uniref:LysE family transporter n=1 Tax=Cohnella sp. TaxID=1883426 RepID=UPI003564C18C